MPSTAEALPEWNWVVVAAGVAAPPVVQEFSPFSKPPLSTCNAFADGVTALDGGDSGPVPAGLDAVTVNV